MAARLVVLLLGLVVAPALAGAQDGATLYRSYCASCHDAGGATRAPARDALGRLTPERVVDALETGTMNAQGMVRNQAERRALALYLSGKPFGTEKPLGLERSACKEHAALQAPFSAPSWNGWSPSATNTRFQSAAAAGLDANRASQLKLKWAFAFPGDVQAYSQPTVVGGRVFVGSAGRRIYSLDANTGCVHWSYGTDSAVRTAVTVGLLNGSSTYAAYFGDLSANVYAVDASTGTLIWKASADKHPAARVTGAPTLHAGRLYVPVASFEEVTGALPGYECCTFRGSVVALDASTGSQIWKAYTIEDAPRPTGKNKSGVQQWGPSGGGVWNSPTIDVKSNALYVGTGDNYSLPASKTSDAIMALNLDSGKVAWVRQLTADDAWNVACASPGGVNCPNAAAPDYDFAASPILVNLPNGRRALIAGQKSGMVHALDPDRGGEILWQVRAGQGGMLGGIEWGPAADSANLYVAVSDVKTDLTRMDAKAGGGLVALRLTDGKQVWQAAPPTCPAARKGCSPGQSAAVTVIPGVVFSGALDGHVRAYAATGGRIIWDYDTAREFITVNDTPGNGGAINGPGPTVAGGMLFVNSGYGFVGQMPGNVLLAFTTEAGSSAK